jgi:hypothetical protein
MKSNRFTAANGREVIKVVTDSGATGYVDASIPIEAIEAWIRRLDADRKRPIARWRRDLRQLRRRALKPLRKRTRQFRRVKRMRLRTRGRPLIVLR